MIEVKILTLYKTLFFSPQAEARESLSKYTSTVTNKTLEPAGSLLADKTFCGFAFSGAEQTEKKTETVSLEAGKYLFVQFADGELEKAAESLWLESLWLDINVAPEVYERSLEEDGKTVFQLFRKIQ